jgi:hypothetical protein
VHGLLADIQTGKLEWLSNGYQALGTMNSRGKEAVRSASQTVQAFTPLTDFKRRNEISRNQDRRVRHPSRRLGFPENPSTGSQTAAETAARNTSPAAENSSSPSH